MSAISFDNGDGYDFVWYTSSDKAWVEEGEQMKIGGAVKNVGAFKSTPNVSLKNVRMKNDIKHCYKSKLLKYNLLLFFGDVCILSRLDELLEYIDNNNPSDISHELRKEINNLLKQKSYGLIFEKKEKEYFEIWNKKPSKNDLVKIINKDKNGWKLSEEVYFVIHKKNNLLYIIEKQGYSEKDKISIIKKHIEECVTILSSDNKNVYTD